MLQALGRNRIIVLIVLALLNAGAGYGLYQYVIPARENADRTLTTAQSELQVKRAEIQKLKEEYALLQSQLRFFKELEAKGFFNDQSRVSAQESFEKLRTVSGVLKAKYDIAAGELIEDTRASDAGYVILSSPITVELDSLDDVDVYSFLKLIQERFPGKVDIVGMDIKKAREIDPVILRDIGTGKPVTMINSRISFAWRTMASRNSLNADTSVDVQSSTPDLTNTAQPVEVTPAGSAQPAAANSDVPPASPAPATTGATQ